MLNISVVILISVIKQDISEFISLDPEGIIRDVLLALIEGAVNICLELLTAFFNAIFAFLYDAIYGATIENPALFFLGAMFFMTALGVWFNRPGA